MPAFNIAVRGDGHLDTVYTAVERLVADVLADDGQVFNATVHAEDEDAPERVDVDLTPERVEPADGEEPVGEVLTTSTSNDSYPSDDNEPEPDEEESHVPD